MENPYLVQRLTGISQALIAQHASGKGMPNATVGGERETFLREFMQKVFPAHRRFSTGAITDSTGARSGQVDIAVEFGLIPSFPAPGSEERLLLAESVAISMEVKSNLVAQWDQVVHTTGEIKKLVRNVNPIMTIGDPPSPKIPCLAVGHAGHSTIDGLASRLASTSEAERPDGLLVIESGCYYSARVQARGPLALYALCMEINWAIESIGQARPDLAHYVVKNRLCGFRSSCLTVA
jgi:hypothetical protein